jgi:hypothetical protein
MVVTRRIEEQEPVGVDEARQMSSLDLKRVESQIREQNGIIAGARKRIKDLDTVLPGKGLTAHAEAGLITSLEIIRECEINIRALENLIAPFQNTRKPRQKKPFDISTELSRRSMAVLTRRRIYPRK